MFADVIRARWTPLDGTSPPPGCQGGDAGIPWYRADGLRHTVAYVSVEILGLLGMVTLVAGLLRNGRRWDRLRLAGLGLTAATVVVGAAVWGVV